MDSSEADGAVVTGGDHAVVTGGYHATLVLRWCYGERSRVSVGYVGEDGIEAGVRYRLDEGGRFVRAEG